LASIVGFAQSCPWRKAESREQHAALHGLEEDRATEAKLDGLDLGKFLCVFQIIQYCFCPLTHVFTSSLALSLPFRLMDTCRERLAQNCNGRTIWIADAHRGDGRIESCEKAVIKTLAILPPFPANSLYGQKNSPRFRHRDRVSDASSLRR